MKKRNIVMSLLLSGCALTAFAAEGDDLLVLYLDGANHSAKMETVEKITLDDRMLTLVGTDGSKESKPLAQVDKILFGKNATSIAAAKADKEGDVIVRATGYSFTAEGLRDGVTLTVYAADGKVVARSVAKDGKATVNAEGLSNGVYIVKAANKSLKVVKR